MSQTVTPAPALTIVQKLEQLGHAVLDAVDHAAIRLVGFCATTEQSLQTLESNSPILKLVWDAGVASATAHGIPVAAIISGKPQYWLELDSVAIAQVRDRLLHWPLRE